MPKVDFYIINQTTVAEQFFFACRLVEQLVSQEMQVYIQTESEDAASMIDDLLWSFKPDSFIPHAIVAATNSGVKGSLADNISVLIGHGNQASHINQVLINLDVKIPEFHPNFERIVEIVYNNETTKQTSRQHWNSYKAAGYELKHNKV